VVGLWGRLRLAEGAVAAGQQSVQGAQAAAQEVATLRTHVEELQRHNHHLTQQAAGTEASVCTRGHVRCFTRCVQLEPRLSALGACRDI
jgi:hypothetical protein